MSGSSKLPLSLQDVKDLGGTKDDLQLLEGVDSESASELEFDGTGVSDDEDEAVTKNEIQSFIKTLGLDTSVNYTKPPPSLHEDNAPEEHAKQETIDIEKDKPVDQPGKKEKKKKKKKKKGSGESESETITSVGPRDDEEIGRQLLQLSVKSYKRLLVSMDDEAVWYEQAQSSGVACQVAAGVVDHLLQVGEGLMMNEVQVYEQVRQRRKGASEVKWLKTVLSSGTLSDKMAALTLLVQESPVHTLGSLDTLLSMASKKGKRESVLAVDTLKELWITNLLPEGRKLKTMKQHPLDQIVPGASRSLQQCHRTLLLWYYEHQLKNRYAQFLTFIKGLSHDTVANVREKMVGHIFDLLYQRPEQEQELLSQLVNKIGDPVKKIASKVVFFLLKLLDHHVNMKLIVAMAIERLLHRPNIGQKAQYYAVCCLNQFTIGARDEELAGRLIEIFFTFFKLYVKEGQLNAKMLGALLTGVNRAFPFLKGDIPSFEEHLHSLFTVVHVGPLATGIQSLMLLFQVMESRRSVSGRYYQALYTKLMDSALKHSGKQAMFLNLLFKSVKSDPEPNRVKAFLKRILQVCSAHAPPFVCGCLFVVSEILKHKPGLWSYVIQSENSDVEHFTDVVPSSTQTSDEEVQSCDISGDHVTEDGDHVTKGGGYHVGQRNPLYCGAEHTCVWELVQLSKHYHPSVQVFAKKIASGEHIDYRGDPLSDFTLMRFLDRFICKNPKQKKSDHGGSVMQRTTRLTDDLSKEILANSSQFAAMDESKVKVEELFMHRYFTQKATSETSKKKKKEKERAEVEMDMDRFSIGSDEDSDMDFAGELEKQTKSKQQLSRKKGKEQRHSSSDEAESMDDGSDLDMAFVSDEESLVGGEGAEPTEADMERLLLDNLSSESEQDEGEEERGPPRKRKKGDQSKSGGKFDTSSLFAAAEEFAHLLEDSSGYGGRQDVRRKDRASEKQLQWEERKAVPSFGKRRPHSSKTTVKKGTSDKRSSSHSSYGRQAKPGRGRPRGQKGTGKRGVSGSRGGKGKQNKRTRRK